MFALSKINPNMKKVIHTNNAPAAIGPYSQAIEANGMLFISGQIPVNPADGTVVLQEPIFSGISSGHR